MNLTEDEIVRIIRDVENGGRYIHGMLPEAAARAIVMAAAAAAYPGHTVAGSCDHTIIQALEFYADNYVDGGSKARMALASLINDQAGLMDDQKGGGK